LAAAAHAGKVHPDLKARLASGEVMDVIIELPSVDDIFTSPFVTGRSTVEARTANMISMLKDRTAASRKPFVNILSELGLSNQRSIAAPLWISNRFEVKNCDEALATVLARVPGDFVIREPKTVSIIDGIESKPVSIEEVRQNEAQWGVAMIKAPAAWNTTRGNGIVVGIIDTGVHLNHEALQSAYAGAWHDPTHNRPTPDDIQSHGTHCIGSTLGRSNGIGVAPEARWIACRGLSDFGSGSEADLLDCAQWMLSGADPKPHVITNSWGGGSGDPWYNDAMRAWIVAGQIPVFALGNSGPSCRSANSPGDSIYTIGVGATNNADQMASFSSRGPTATMLKPEVSAPGQDIISAGNSGTNSYTSKSGTSMATPHVAGAVALLLAQDPSRNFYAIKELLESTGDQPPVDPADVNCGTGQQWPNNAFGHGRINCENSVNANTTSSVIYF
jgi:subtilisin family serine protease